MVAERISHYQIVRKLGSGGMGEVFEAEDTQLRRRVALKVLPEAMASNKETLDRFRREARALAALNHPNIVTVYSVEEAGGQHFLTMELVQGKPLTEVIPKQGLEMAEFSHLAIPLADALAAAHEKGIAHRDLKPSNVMVTDRGSVKVIDFGLAKLVERKGGNGGGDETTRLQTMEGRILGTPAYMSPEQIEGKPLDPRTDIFSLGVMLCEMTTGKRPFKGDTPMSVMSAVLKDPAPPVRDLKPNLPPGLGRIIHRCLEKDPAKRYQTASALRTDLLDLSDTTKTIQAAAPESSAVGMGRRWLPWIVLGSAAVIMVLFLLPKTPTGQENRAAQAQPRVGGASQSASNQPLIMRLSPSRQITYETGIEDWPSFAPDGNRIIYAAEANGFKSLVIRSLKTGENTQLPRTNRDEIMPAWNPANQEEIVFVRHTAPGGKLEVTDVYGGFFLGGGALWKRNLRTGEEILLSDGAFNPSFATNGTLAFHRESGDVVRIWTCTSDGGRLEQQTRDDSSAIYHLEPSFAPDGTKIVYRREEKNRSSLWIIDLATREQFALTQPGLYVQPAWSPSGKYIYFSSYLGRSAMNLWRIAVDQKGKALSDPEPVTSGQGADLHPAISPSGGQLLFCISLANSDVWKLPVDKVTGLSNGPPSAVISTSREDSRGAWSPDEKWIAFNSDRENQNMNLWVHNMENGSERQITRGPGGDYQPNWAPEGTSLVFFSLRSGNADLWAVDIENGQAHGEPRQLTTDRGQDMNPFFSPDGKHIAFMSDRSGRTEIYVMNRDGSDQRRVSSSETGGHFLRWRGNSVVFNTRFNEQWCAAQSSLDGKTEVWIPIKPLPTDPKWAVGGHMSLSPDNSVMMELRNHLELWAVPSNGELPKLVFAFAGGERIDYPVWSPSGNWVLMDRMLSQGSDIYMVEGLE